MQSSPFCGLLRVGLPLIYKNKNLNAEYRTLTAQMAECSCRLTLDSELGQTNNFEIGIHSFPA